MGDQQLEEPLLISSASRISDFEKDTRTLNMNSNLLITQLKFSSFKEEWNNKKKEALKYLYENKTDETLKCDLYAYKEEESYFLDVNNQNDFIKKFKKNCIGLTPLIYSIWGNEDKNSIISLSEKLKSEENESNYEKIFIENVKSLCQEFQHYELFIENQYTVKKLIKRKCVYDILDDYIKMIMNTIEKYNYYELFIDELLYGYLHTHNIEYLTFIVLSDHSDILKELIISGEFEVIRNKVGILLSRAIQIKAVKCSELIFEYIVEMLNDSHENKTEFPVDLLENIEHEIANYLTTPSIYFKDLISLLIKEKSKILQEDPNNLPICKMIEDKTEIENIFKNIEDENEFVNVKICNSIIKLPAVIGSENSVNFFKNLESSQNPDLFKSSMIKYYVKCKWDSLWPFIMFRDLLLLSNIPLLILLNFAGNDEIAHSSYILWTFITINLLLAIFESIQLVALGPFEYFGNINKLHFWGFTFILCSCFIAFVAIFDKTILQSWMFSEPVLYFIYAIIFSFYIAESNPRSQSFHFLIILAILLVPSLECIYFWFEYEYLIYITDSLIILSIAFIVIASIGNSLVERASGLGLSLLRLTIMITSLCCGFYKFQLVFILEIFSAGLLVNHILTFPNEKKILVLFADFIVITFVSLNFIFDYFYIINSILFIQCVLSIYLEISARFDALYDITTSFFSYFCVLLLVGINPSHSQIQYILVAVLSFAHIPLWNNFVKNESNSSLKKLYMKWFIYNFKTFLFDWNTVDVIRLILCGIWSYSIFVNSESPTIIYALSVFTFLRGLTSFRSFDGTRYYVRLIFNSIEDISSFLIIFFYSTLCFGIIIGTTKEKVNYEFIWIYSYNLNLGEFGSDDQKFNLLYITFIVATVLNVIIMLNLLISILGDSFDKFQLSCQEIDCSEMASVILEIELMMSLFRRNTIDNGLYLTFCESDSDVKHVWEGKMLLIRKQLDEINNKMTTNDEKINKLIVENDEKMNTLISENNQKINENYEKINEKIGVMDEKISESSEAIKRIENFIESKFSS